MQHWQCRLPCARCGTWFNEAHQNIAVTPNALPYSGSRSSTRCQYTGPRCQYTGTRQDTAVFSVYWQTLPVYCTGTALAASTPAYFLQKPIIIKDYQSYKFLNSFILKFPPPRAQPRFCALAQPRAYRHRPDGVTHEPPCDIVDFSDNVRLGFGPG